MVLEHFLCVLAIGWLAVGHSQANVILHDDTVDNDIAGSSELIDLSHLGPELYGEPDENVGKLVANYNPATDSRNVEELGSYVEGDMLIDRPSGRNGLADTASRWPKGVVPFVVSGNFDAKGMQLIEQAINEYHAKTCIRFVPRMGERNYVSFESSDTGCWSSVGMIGGKQAVNLQIPGCTTLVGTVMHEMMHALGFLHEQNREDRDGWVKILYENIKPGTKNNFEKAKTGSTNNFGVAYDYGSIMHYSANAFSTNKKPTIEAKRAGANNMGQRSKFSSSDLAKLNAMYGCRGASSTAGTGAGGSNAQTQRPGRPTRPSKPAGINRPGAQVASAIVNLIGGIFGEEDSNTTANALDNSLNGAKMGQRDGFSWNDMEKLNRMYQCQGSKGNGQTFLRPPGFGVFPSTGVSGPAGPTNQGGGPYFPPSGHGPFSPYYPPNGGAVFPYAPYPGAGYPGPGFGYYPYDVSTAEHGEATKEKKLE
uniref:Metalloendopeptidase n=1 Tax=Anopheles minimus TaxID=112268 RepID=A0A182VPR5_9DIPT